MRDDDTSADRHDAGFIKRRDDAPAGFFAAEARGLDALRATGTLRVPRILDVSQTRIVLEDLGRGRASEAQWEAAGARLADLHRVRTLQFGFSADGYCGDSPQRNTPMDDGWEFFAHCRLQPQLARGRDRGLLSADDVRAGERICAGLRNWIPAQPATVVHGDLWMGNLHACGDGELALIDGGAVHHGWAETDLAMLTLFGAPPSRFFAAYESSTGSDGSWRERAPLYNLYHLLNHLSLFGTGYLGAVRQGLRRFA